VDVSRRLLRRYDTTAFLVTALSSACATPLER
jgi:hypothetical protein